MNGKYNHCIISCLYSAFLFHGFQVEACCWIYDTQMIMWDVDSAWPDIRLLLKISDNILIWEWTVSLNAVKCGVSPLLLRNADCISQGMQWLGWISGSVVVTLHCCKVQTLVKQPELSYLYYCTYAPILQVRINAISLGFYLIKALVPLWLLLQCFKD
jgi:hypothetical protein